MVQFSYKSDIMLIVGLQKQGKTYLTKAFCRSIPSFIFIDPHYQASEIGFCVHYPERIVPAFNKWKKVIYQPAKGQDTDEAYVKAFKEIIKLTNFTLILDEIDEFANSYGYLSQDIREIIRRGRLQGIGIIGNTRRPSLIHKDIRANAIHVITFMMHEEDDLKYMANWFNIAQDRIRNLESHHSIYLNTLTHIVTPLAPYSA
jgi:hypothetical protein